MKELFIDEVTLNRKVRIKLINVFNVLFILITECGFVVENVLIK